MYSKKINSLYMALLFCIAVCCACIRNLDEPPLYNGTNMVANISIRALRNSHIPGNFEHLLNNDIITGIVIANDATDNFYKTIVVQDSTAGISVRLDGFGLSADYPLGMRVFLRLNGLWMGAYGGMLQLGGSVNRSNILFPELIPIPTPLFSKVLVKGALEKIPNPLKIKFEQLNDSVQSRLIQLDSVEFVTSDTAKTFADIVNKATVSHTIRFCNGGSIYLRTSGFASFAALKTPRGNGCITGIYTIFGSQKQLAIRDTSDIGMNGLRCNGSVPRTLFLEDFESGIARTNIAINGWKNLAETGAKFFQVQQLQSNQFAEISAAATAQSTVISWLVLPAINLNNSSNEQLSFITKDVADNGAALQVLLSSNYDGGNQPWKAKWTVLKATVAKGSVNGIAAVWTPSGNIPLNAFSGLITIAFRYEGNDLANVANKRTTGFHLDQIKLVGN
ncbi:MAG: hypothetical protein EAZ35_01600 [Sphingobacteriia bacterium]|nr:MAG: hypothetical protein EAZ41_05525 [Sphingobacteriia bacterium]TAG31778.1 MAG: hypothetical protein EAZ35_01600 [Sphingobacteriia bacterium]